MSLINWIKYSEPGRGQSSPSGEDIINRPLRDVLTLSGLSPDTDFPGFATGYTGNGSPEGVVTGGLGLLYRQGDGGNGTILWVKSTTTGNTGWLRLNITDGRANAQRFLSLLHRNAEDATLLLVADSTGVSTYWSPIFFNALAALFPAYTVTLRYWSTVSNAYGAPATIQVGTGAQTLNIYNCAISGANTATHCGPYHYAMIAAPQADYVMVSLGHNENANASYWSEQMIELLITLIQYSSQSEFCLVGQNPSALDNNQALRARVYQQLAARFGMGWIDIEQFMNDTGGAAVYTSADHIHPNAIGSAFWAACVLAAFHYSEIGDTQPSTFPWLTLADSPIPNSDFSNFPAGATVPTGWVAGGSAVITKDLVNYESANQYGVKIQASGGVSAKMQYTFNGTKYAGQWVTFFARIFVDLLQPSSAGELGISDHVSSDTNSRISTVGQGAFRWVVHHHFVDPASTQITVIIYGDQTTTNGACTVDRVGFCTGIIPVLALRRGAIDAAQVQPGIFPDGTFEFGAATNNGTEFRLNGGVNKAISLAFRWASIQRWVAQLATTGKFLLLCRDTSGNSIDIPITVDNTLGGDITVPRPIVARQNWASKSANYTVVDRDDGFFLTGAGATLTLQASATRYRPVTMRNSGAGNWTVAAGAGDTVSGGATITLTPGQFVRLMPNGTDWQTVG